MKDIIILDERDMMWARRLTQMEVVHDRPDYPDVARPAFERKLQGVVGEMASAAFLAHTPVQLFRFYRQIKAGCRTPRDGPDLVLPNGVNVGVKCHSHAAPNLCLSQQQSIRYEQGAPVPWDYTLRTRPLTLTNEGAEIEIMGWVSAERFAVEKAWQEYRTGVKQLCVPTLDPPSTFPVHTEAEENVDAKTMAHPTEARRVPVFLARDHSEMVIEGVHYDQQRINHFKALLKEHRWDYHLKLMLAQGLLETESIPDDETPEQARARRAQGVLKKGEHEEPGPIRSNMNPTYIDQLTTLLKAKPAHVTVLFTAFDPHTEGGTGGLLAPDDDERAAAITTLLSMLISQGHAPLIRTVLSTPELAQVFDEGLESGDITQEE